MKVDILFDKEPNQTKENESGFEKRSIFKRNRADFNSGFSFF